MNENERLSKKIDRLENEMYKQLVISLLTSVGVSLVVGFVVYVLATT